MSKGFKVKDGDVVLDKTIELVAGTENTRTKAELVIGTNQGEWSFDAVEGIDFRVVLCKNPDEAEIRGTIEQALQHSLDPTFVITEFSLTIEKRCATIDFKAVNSNGVEIGGAYTYGN